MYIKKKVDQKFFKKTGYCRNLSNFPYEDLIFNGPAFPTSSVIIKKSIFKKINFFVGGWAQSSQAYKKIVLVLFPDIPIYIGSGIRTRLSVEF